MKFGDTQREHVHINDNMKYYLYYSYISQIFWCSTHTHMCTDRQEAWRYSEVHVHMNKNMASYLDNTCPKHMEGCRTRDPRRHQRLKPIIMRGRSLGEARKVCQACCCKQEAHTDV
jgi:hypothetical protein